MVTPINADPPRAAGSIAIHAREIHTTTIQKIVNYCAKFLNKMIMTILRRRQRQHV
jgi:hypothetical protein